MNAVVLKMVKPAVLYEEPAIDAESVKLSLSQCKSQPSGRIAAIEGIEGL